MSARFEDIHPASTPRKQRVNSQVCLVDAIFLAHPPKTESARHRVDVGLALPPYAVVEFAEPALPANQRQVDLVGELVGRGDAIIVGRGNPIAGVASQREDFDRISRQRPTSVGGAVDNGWKDYGLSWPNSHVLGSRRHLQPTSPVIMC